MRRQDVPLACLYNLDYVILRIFRENLSPEGGPGALRPWGPGG